MLNLKESHLFFMFILSNYFVNNQTKLSY